MSAPGETASTPEPRWRAISESPRHTRALGRALGERLRGGQCVLLIGELGAGKTTFAAGVGEGLEIPEPVRSPTYLLCAEHAGRHRLLHLDAYFTERMESLLLEGLAERFDAEAVLLVEWGDRLAEWWPEDRVVVRLDGGGTRREITVSGHGTRSAETVAALARDRQDISRGSR